MLKRNYEKVGKSLNYRDSFCCRPKEEIKAAVQKRNQTFILFFSTAASFDDDRPGPGHHLGRLERANLSRHRRPQSEASDVHGQRRFEVERQQRRRYQQRRGLTRRDAERHEAR